MKSQRWMSQNFFAFFMTWGIYLPYWTGFLIAIKHLSIGQASFVMSIGLIARGISTLFIFPYLTKKWSAKTVLNVLAFSSLISAMLYIPIQSYTVIIVVTILFSLCYPALMPALDSVAGVLVQHGQLHYGKSRSYGSIGFIVMVFITSLLTGIFGDDALLYLLIIGLVGLASLTTYQVPEPLKHKPEQVDSKLFSVKNLFKTKHFTIIILIGFLLQGAHAAYYNYGYIYLQYLEVPKYFIGLIINIGVLFEILFFAKADALFSKWHPAKLLALAAFGSTLRWAFVALVPNVFVFVISQSLHALSFAMTHYAIVMFFNNKLPKEQIPNAQGIYSALAMSWSTAVLTYISGMLYEVKPGYAFLCMIICTIPAFFLAFTMYRKEKSLQVN